MCKFSHGPILQKRTINFLEILLGLGSRDIRKKRTDKTQVYWSDLEYDNYFRLIVRKTKLKELARLVNDNSSDHEDDVTTNNIRESIILLRDFLGILTDNRKDNYESGIWNFTLDLCSKNKAEVLLEIDRLWEKKRNNKHKIKKIKQENSVIKALVFANSDDHKTKEYLKRDLEKAQDIKLYSIGLNWLWDEKIFALLKKRVIDDTNLKVKICLANVSSPEIILRFSREGEHSVGIKGLQERINKKFLILEKKVDDLSRFAVKLFDHYPTNAMLIFDNHIYTHCYPPINTLGNDAPIFYWEDGSEASSFYHNQFNNVWNNSKLASEVYKRNNKLSNCKELKHDDYKVEICFTQVN